MIYRVDSDVNKLCSQSETATFCSGLMTREWNVNI